MFTGIVQILGRIGTVQQRPFGIHLTIEHDGWDNGTPSPGDSVCISGVCLTVVESTQRVLSFDVVAETLAKTTLGDIEPGQMVNLEPALTPNTPIGGHFVQGHIDGLGQITGVRADTDDRRITVVPAVESPAVAAELMEAIVPKGSVAIDGVSLTVAAVDRSQFEVALIPTTLEHTTLGRAKVDDRVNLETDIVSKTVVHWLRQRSASQTSVSMDNLRNAGFLGQ